MCPDVTECDPDRTEPVVGNEEVEGSVTPAVAFVACALPALVDLALGEEMLEEPNPVDIVVETDVGAAGGHTGHNIGGKPEGCLAHDTSRAESA